MAPATEREQGRALDAAGPVSTVVRHPLRIRRLEVRSVTHPTPRLARVALGGPELEGFVQGAPDDHVKVFFPPVGTTEPVLPELGPNGVVWPTEGPKPIARDYTPFVVDDELVLDLVLHQGGHASGWARRAAAGDVVGVAGPRGSHVLNRSFATYVFVGDETALPAVRAWLTQVPAAATAYAYLEVADAADQQVLPSPARTMVRWVHRGEREPGTAGLLDEVLAHHRGSLDDAFVWVAGEAAVVQRLRAELLDRRHLDPDRLHARGYWKRGAADHQEPHED